MERKLLIQDTKLHILFGNGRLCAPHTPLSILWCKLMVPPPITLLEEPLLVRHLQCGSTAPRSMHNQCPYQVDTESPHNSKTSLKTPRSIPAEHHSSWPIRTRSMHHNRTQGCQSSSTLFLLSCTGFPAHSPRHRCTQHKNMRRLGFQFA